MELDADPEVMRYVTGEPTPPDRVRDETLPRFLDYHARSPDAGFFAGIERATGRFIGWFHLRPAPDSPPGETELGYRLRRDAWGRGYATEVSRALVDKAFGELGMRRVIARAMAVNTDSWRVMEKAGLRRVKIVYKPWPDPLEGTEHGDVEYAIDREEWLARQ